MQILYDRLENARAQADQLVIRNRPTEMQTMLSFQRKSRNSLPSFQNGQEMYEHFFTEVLQPFVRGEMDQQAFEDVSREMYGVNSFTLFTLDKVVAQLTKQVRIRFPWPDVITLNVTPISLCRCCPVTCARS